MQKLPAFIYSIAAASFLILALFAFRPSALLQLLSLVFFVVGTIAFALSLTLISEKQGYRKFRNYFPLVSIIAAFVFALQTGRLARKLYFSSQLTQLQEFIETVPPTSSRKDGYTWNGVPITSGNTSGGDRYVFFWWGSGFPVKHSVLAYHSGTTQQARQEFDSWSRGSQFRDHWYFLSH